MVVVLLVVEQAEADIVVMVVVVEGLPAATVLEVVVVVGDPMAALVVVVEELLEPEVEVEVACNGVGVRGGEIILLLILLRRCRSRLGVCGTKLASPKEV